VEEVARLIVRFREQGMTILLVEQNAELALSISDHGYVLETGTILFNDKAANLLNNPQVKQAYLGL
jgi:branched-chain amino acid transport system ATP-binding protein